jgi:hypothetical protein
MVHQRLANCIFQNLVFGLVVTGTKKGLGIRSVRRGKGSFRQGRHNRKLGDGDGEGGLRRGIKLLILGHLMRQNRHLEDVVEVVILRLLRTLGIIHREGQYCYEDTTPITGKRERTFVD